ncbi:hypothetical protein WICMUC_000330 [Wickerhamomyces mucosus]|uniref:Uncharacterized protein n=1 Tax=Wickerhamomyces mucosus TaxID=1378264 RepID=A0A9P8Q048_9ASCO|nr:hypothetical protein WICMUC_000330 [Wickerhamomyces mucosus]
MSLENDFSSLNISSNHSLKENTISNLISEVDEEPEFSAVETLSSDDEKFGDNYPDIYLKLSSIGSIEINEGEESFNNVRKALNEIKSFNEGTSRLKDEKELEEKIEQNLNILSPYFKRFKIWDHNSSIQEFLKIVSLTIASFKINSMVKIEHTTPEIINQVIKIYLEVINVLKRLKPSDSKNLLLSKCSFITPLLIYTSLNYKLKLHFADSLTKILTLILTYHLKTKPLLDGVANLFQQSNSEVYQVFNKLWEKTFQRQRDDNMDLNFIPGPREILNRFELFQDYDTSLELIYQIIPYKSNNYILKLSQEVVSVYNILKSLNNSMNHETDKYYLCQLLPVLSTHIGSQSIGIMLQTLNIDIKFLNMKKQSGLFEEYQAIAFRVGSVIPLEKIENDLTIRLLSDALDTPILEAIGHSAYARYKVLFEVIDHNYKIEFENDFQISLCLEMALLYTYRNFDIVEDHSAVTDLGSTFSLDGVLTHLIFLVNSALMKNLNPKKDFPKSLKDKINFGRFPPLPKSNFLDFESFSSSKIQSNLSNFERLIHSNQLLSKIFAKLLQGYGENKDLVSFNGKLGSLEINSEFRIQDVLLELYYTVLFSNLLVSNELISLSEYSSSIFYDYRSLGNIIKIQTFELFENIFQFFGSFAVFKLIQHIEELSMKDLKLQSIAFKLLHHLTFHSNKELIEIIKNSNLISDLISDYVKLWNDGTDQYDDFLKLLELENDDKNSITLVPFDATDYLEILGYTKEHVSPLSTNASTNIPSENNYGNTSRASRDFSNQTSIINDQLKSRINSLSSNINTSPANSFSMTSNDNFSLNSSLNSNVSQAHIYQKKNTPDNFTIHGVNSNGLNNFEQQSKLDQNRYKSLNNTTGENVNSYRNSVGSVQTFIPSQANSNSFNRVNNQRNTNFQNTINNNFMNQIGSNSSNNYGNNNSNTNINYNNTLQNNLQSNGINPTISNLNHQNPNNSHSFINMNYGSNNYNNYSSMSNFNQKNYSIPINEIQNNSNYNNFNDNSHNSFPRNNNLQ